MCQPRHVRMYGGAAATSIRTGLAAGTQYSVVLVAEAGSDTGVFGPSKPRLTLDIISEFS